MRSDITPRGKMADIMGQWQGFKNIEAGHFSNDNKFSFKVKT